MAADLYPTYLAPAMDRWLARLERRLGGYAPHNLTWWIVGLSGLVYLLLYLKPELSGVLAFDRDAVASGEIWRLVTFLFLPWQTGRGGLDPLWTLFALWFLYFVGSSLEAEWGSFKFDVYYFVGALCTIAAAFLFGAVTNFYLNMSLVLAAATMFPNVQIQIFLVIPARMKWLGLLTGGFLAYLFVLGSPPIRAGIAAAMVNYLLFFAAPLAKRMRVDATVAARRRQIEGLTAVPVRKPRVCAKCGRSEKDDPNLEFRLCDCADRCRGKLTEYCLEHARAH
jgi:hypothetical protein